MASDLTPAERAAIDYFLAVAPDAPLTLEVEAWRALWRSGVEIFNAGAPARPVERGVVLREQDGRRLCVDIYPADGPVRIRCCTRSTGAPGFWAARRGGTSSSAAWRRPASPR